MKSHILLAIFGIINAVKSQDTLAWKCINISYVKIDKYFWLTKFIVLNNNKCKLDTLEFYGTHKLLIIDDSRRSRRYLFLPGQEMKCIINKTCWEYTAKSMELSYYNFVDWDTNNCRKIIGYNSKKSRKAIRKGKYLRSRRMFNRYYYNPSCSDYMLLNSQLVEVISVKIGI
jgi:hypothetical protein